MSGPEKSKHWDLLAEEIGIDVPAEPPVQGSVETPPVQQPRPKIQKLATSQQTSPAQTDWGSLAKTLGVAANFPAEAKMAAGPPPLTDYDSEGISDEDASSPEATPSVRPADARETNVTKTGKLTGPFPIEGSIDFDESEKSTPDPTTSTPRRRRRRHRRANYKGTKTAKAQDRSTLANAVENRSPTDSQEASDNRTTETPTEPHQPTDEPRSARTGHRGITPWEEAIGVIVDANLEARASRPKISRSGGQRSGNSRGRGRKR